MSAETDLLPITWADFWMSRGDTERAHDFESFSFADHYARACVSSATEALRVEVERWKSLHATAYDAFRTGVATERRLEARVGRLAEALRRLLANGDIRDAAHKGDLAQARAALEQETTNG